MFYRLASNIYSLFIFEMSQRRSLAPAPAPPSPVHSEPEFLIPGWDVPPWDIPASQQSNNAAINRMLEEPDPYAHAVNRYIYVPSVPPRNEELL